LSAWRKRASLIQRRRSTSSRCMMAICPVGPPKLMNPSFSQKRNASPNEGASTPGGPSAAAHIGEPALAEEDVKEVERARDEGRGGERPACRAQVGALAQGRLREGTQREGLRRHDAHHEREAPRQPVRHGVGKPGAWLAPFDGLLPPGELDEVLAGGVGLA